MRLRDPMPELEGAEKWFNSRPMSRKDLIGEKPTLIHFWSVSCGTCKTAMPKVNDFRDEYKRELNVITVHMPRSEQDKDLNEIKSVAREHDISQPIFVDNERKLTDAFKNRYVPAYYVFDSDGKLRHYQSGGGGMNMLRKRVNRVLGKSGK
ncbi:TlpA family protein disulfide reductase [Virgibacillus doumboii]|uniref:TlpA family protein disulfide reductase n=1 Tax=Virgibacillus doumboii TaxID=2697503 RepID=UPI0013DF88E5|nr:redoxin domain-containing protein [Virgibacillus doumboii]